MYRFSLALAVLMLAGSSLGHFMLDVPTGRGFADATNTQAPCGGYNVSSAPVDFFLGLHLLAHCCRPVVMAITCSNAIHTRAPVVLFD